MGTRSLVAAHHAVENKPQQPAKYRDAGERELYGIAGFGAAKRAENTESNGSAACACDQKIVARPPTEHRNFPRRLRLGSVQAQVVQKFLVRRKSITVPAGRLG